MGICDAPDTVPEWEIGKSGPRLVRPSSYFTNAKKFIEDNRRKGIVGVVFKNTFGRINSCTLLQYMRMIDLFEEGQCEVVDWVRNHHMHEYAGLQGYDTEGVEAFAQAGM